MKKNLRKQYTETRNAISQTDKIQWSQLLTETLTQLDAIKNAHVVASFVSFRSEISTLEINQWLLNQNKTLLLPKVDSATNTLKFYEVYSLNTLKKGAFGILEPDEILCKAVPIENIEVILTPGLAFDQEGYRLGYGGGFYDKVFSATESRTKRIGIGFSCQSVQLLPHERFDLPVHYFVSEKGVQTFDLSRA